MEHEQQYKALLTKNSAQNNLLALNLLQSQENWSKEKALTWILEGFISHIQTLQQDRLFHFGNTSLSFIFHHAKIEEDASISNHTIAPNNTLYRGVLICRAQNQQQSKLLYKIDYIEEATHLLNTYKQHLLEHLEQIVRNFVVEID